MREKHGCFGAVSSVAIPKRKDRTSFTEGEITENYSVVVNKSVLSSYFCFSLTIPFSPYSCKRRGGRGGILVFVLFFSFSNRILFAFIRCGVPKVIKCLSVFQKTPAFAFLNIFRVCVCYSRWDSLFFHSFNCSHKP